MNDATKVACYVCRASQGSIGVTKTVIACAAIPGHWYRQKSQQSPAFHVQLLARTTIRHYSSETGGALPVL